MNLLPSIIRTLVPLLVGFIASWLAALGIDVTDDQQAVLITLFGSVVGALWYVLARIVERRFPSWTWLLGSKVQPAVYRPSVTPEPVPAGFAQVQGDPAVPALPDPPGRHEAPDVPAGTE